MQFRGGDFVQILLDWVTRQRKPPNQVVGALLSMAPDTEADDFQLVLIETAVRLEEMYDQIHQNEWNDWRRVDYWTNISSKHSGEISNAAELLLLKSEVYRSVTLIAADVIQLKRQGKTIVTGKDLLTLWEARGSTYF